MTGTITDNWWTFTNTDHRRSYITCSLNKFVSIKTFILVNFVLACVGQNPQLRQFPPLFNAAKDKLISTSPSDSTCGVPVRNAYCRSSTIATSVGTCLQNFCVQTCPGRYSLPNPVDLVSDALSPGFGACVSLDMVNKRPKSGSADFSRFISQSGDNCYLFPSTSPDVGQNGAFTLTVWFWMANTVDGPILQKIRGDTGAVIFEVGVNPSGVRFHYQGTSPATITLDETIPQQEWVFLAIQVYNTAVSFFLNGLGPGFSAVRTFTLISQIEDVSGQYRMGKRSNGTGQFLGRLQNFHFYSTTLTNREIQEVYTGTLPPVRIQSQCRCPGSHPRVKPQQTHYCIPNGLPDNAGQDRLRINEESHPLEYANDGDSNSIWISKFFSQVNITVDLGDEFQVFYVVIQFYSPQPRGVVIERQRNGSDEWELWQLYADNCQTFFGQPNNGPLPQPTSVNCIQFGWGGEQIPYSRGNITFNILAPEPVARPGHNKFYNTPELFEFVRAKKLRINFRDHYYVGQDAQIRHQYYGIYDYTVSARCDCHGHAEHCDISTLPYRCNCTQDSHTLGNQCSQCAALFNNKPFRRGDQTNSYNCQPCVCYNHADSCQYNRTIDLFPNEHDRGGGGMCIDCKHNTTGAKCDTCLPYYYRPAGVSMFSPDVCTPCLCNTSGVVNDTDCAKVDGQCSCKVLVEGRQCDRCKQGYYNLRADNPAGCLPCQCNSHGTVGGEATCDALTGKCNCKKNVQGDRCDQCQFGFFNLTVNNPDGCNPCNCDPIGSTSMYCEPNTGDCRCKASVVGKKCDQCHDNYYNFTVGCIPCGCAAAGTEPGTVCNKTTGQCVCKGNTEGQNCDLCKDGAYSFGSSPDLGCEACICDPRGTLNGMALCDKATGACVCKERVDGRRCNVCKGNTWGLNISDPLGCKTCDCDPSGTTFGDVQNVTQLACDQNTGICSCLPQRLGRRCDDCQSGYFVDRAPGGGCRSCDCNTMGTLPGTNCNTQTGQCECKGGTSGVTGRTCAECLGTYYKFNAFFGTCTECGCLAAGSQNNTCNAASGQCFCKQFVTSQTCQVCVAGASNLDPNNPFGCSKEPSQQPPPTHNPRTMSMELTWRPPDYPNGVIQEYRVIRNASVVATINGSSELKYEDVNLLPFTNYAYNIEAVNAFGSVRSTTVVFRTLAGIPSNDSILTVTDVGSHSAVFSWTYPSVMNGPLEKFKLVSRTPGQPATDLTHWEGTELSAILTNLIPFTTYNFSAHTCTSGGCSPSAVFMITTLSSVPEGQASPRITPLSSTELFIKWDHPSKPNGIIIFYELWMQGVPGVNGTRNPPLRRIFTSSGQYNPRVSSTQNNALPPPITNFTVNSLEPFTVYEFQVLAQNDAGKAASPWTVGRTWEAAPIFTPPPVIKGVSSTELNVTWKQPQDDVARGVIISYRVYQYRRTDTLANPFAPPMVWVKIHESPSNEFHKVVQGFTPFSEHQFQIEACNSIACVNSTAGTGKTLLAAPVDVRKPFVDGFNSSVMKITWEPPTFQNGPPPVYTIEKTSIALSSPAQVVSGTRFPGGGYYKFLPNVIPQNVGFTGIRFKFRMKAKNGLVFFTATPSQDEFFVVQFENGRPRLVFDTQGCLTITEINSTTDGNVSYADEVWHNVVAVRSASAGRIKLDQVEGNSPVRDKNCRNTSIIGQTTGVYVGGLPTDFKMLKLKDKNAGIVRSGFQGCLKDIEILQQEFPEEVWQELKWEDAVANDLAFLNWEGCPLNLDKGAHFMGKGYARFAQQPLYPITGDIFTVSLSFRTAMHTGLLFFVHGGTGIYVYAGLIQGVLRFEFSDGQQTTTVLFNTDTVNLCDGNWRNVIFRKNGLQANVTFSDGANIVHGDPDVSLTVPTMSPISVGGIKAGSEEETFIKENSFSLPIEPFGGCIADFMVMRGYSYTYDFLTTLDVMNLNMDGCPPFSVPQVPCEEKLVTTLYEGTNNVTYDSGLQPYTDYIYRVTATNAAGGSSGPWGYGRTREGSPVGVVAPYRVRALSGYIIEAFWLKPTSTSGLLTKYVLTAYNQDNQNVTPVFMEFTDAETRGANMSGVIPYTNYLMKIAACTSGGCTESQNGTQIRTDEEAPENVQPPVAEAGPTYLLVKWGEPSKPNGLITGYFLYMDNRIIYTGGRKEFNVTNLRVFTGYSLYIKACTSAGCMESPSVVLNTAQLPPSAVSRPRLLALGTNRVDVKWSKPEQLNGMLDRYILYLSLDASSPGLVVYNNSDAFTSYILTNLTAGTTYYIRLAACTGGGCRRSDPSSVTTEESAPDGVPAPVVTSPSPSELFVTWTVPQQPNGAIVRYDLYQNGIKVSNTLVREFRVASLQPYSLHIFQVAACTSIGCGFSEEVQARTQESPPAGTVLLDVVVADSRSVNASWTAPASPNGKLYYDVYFEGLFYKDPDNWDYSIVRERRSLYRDTTVYQLITITGLIPMSGYTVQVNASNTRSFILSATAQADLPPGSPDGVRPPVLVSETSTSIRVTWQAVGRVNAEEDAAYILQFREKRPSAIIQDVFGPTVTLSYLKQNLLPFNEYEFRLQAFNSLGSTYSTWVPQVTKQDRPVGLDPPTIAEVQARYISLTWIRPLNPNGIIREYRLYENGQVRLTLPGNQTSFQANNLIPYTYYMYSIEACTVGGCTKSADSNQVRTLQAVPDGILAPNLTALSPTTVQITWTAPSNPNGVLQQYMVERRLNGTDNAALVATVAAAADRAHVDASPVLSPHTVYQYRVRVINTAGEGTGPWATITTKPSRPAGVNPPTVTVLNSTAINVTWQTPLQLNGKLEFYIIRLPEPRMEVRNVTQRSAIMTGLTPYTEYVVTLTACTSGGCTESIGVTKMTSPDIPDGQQPPTPTAVSQSMISILWQRPTRPNGPTLRYELARQKIRQPLDSTINDVGVWQSLYTGTGLFYEDRGLPMFTTYVYRVTVFNDIGQKTSNGSTEVTTFGGFPRRAANVTLRVVDHLSILVQWTVPSPEELQGEVQVFRVNVTSTDRTFSRTVPGADNSTLLQNLSPNTDYTVTLTLTIYGGASLTSEAKTARTEDGAPSGLSPPTLTIISSQTLRISWMDPQKPNGDITGYNVFIDGRKIPTNQTTAGSIVVPGLQPYTVYRIWIEACTQFNCTQSPIALGTTAEALPQGVSVPSLQALGATSVQVTWTAPAQPNGITVRYDVWRKTMRKCSDVPQPNPDPELTKCTYVQCGVLQNICGGSCYSGAKTCCDGVLHDIKSGYACCGKDYLSQPSLDAVCCGGKFYGPVTGYRCCGTRYVAVRAGEVCCPDSREDRVSIGMGDQCCGAVPFSSTGAQICCAGTLSVRYGHQCCGGAVVTDTAVCCGNDTVGAVYLQQSLKTCCGTQYVDADTTLCCSSDTGHSKVHYYSDSVARQTANELCCGLEKISGGLDCCNFVGYNRQTQVCADMSNTTTGCGMGAVCSVNQRNTAFCDRCDFDHSTSSCGSVSGYHVSTTTATTPAESCSTAVDKVSSSLNLTYTDTGLSPYSDYEYSVSVVNSAGSSSSSYVGVQTLQAAPGEVKAPVTRVNPDQLYIIYLTWDTPGKPNGVISRYILKRDGIELYRGLDMKYTDNNSVLPYKTYSYILSACTQAGCTDSNVVQVATAQAAPEDVLPPTMIVEGPTVLRIQWQPPGKPNGVVTMYRVIFPDLDRGYNQSVSDRDLTVTNLTPYTAYTAVLEVCSQAGCTQSQNVTVTTDEAAPEGVDPPKVVIIDSTTVQLYWKPPTTLNGVLLGYKITRIGLSGVIIIYNGLNLSVADTNLTSSGVYSYTVAARTSAGETTSTNIAVIIPQRTPLNIPPPQRVRVLGSEEISVSWDPVISSQGIIDQYKVLLNVGQSTEVEVGVGTQTTIIVSNLTPYTQYEVRLQACLENVQNGCGTSPGVTVTTEEAPPLNQKPPLLVARSSDAILISWAEPGNPNGQITMYRIYQRKYGNPTEILINQVDGSTRTFTHSGTDLTPYTVYEYRIKALNAQGESLSDWARVRTLEAPPEELSAPFVLTTGPYGFSLQWTPPSKPNGVITMYKILYKGVSADPTVQSPTNTLIVEATKTSTSISGLQPYTNYEIRLQAVNKAGSVTSGTAPVKTAQTSPSGLSVFRVEKIISGQAAILRWDMPTKPNGMVTNFRIYEVGSDVAIYQGLNREFEFRRLLPYTDYLVQLEACTVVGCTLGQKQTFTTAEVAPASQPPPSPTFTNSTHVLISWKPAANPNGKISSYQVLRRTNTPTVSRRKRAVSDPTVIYMTTDTNKPEYQYMDLDVQPYTQYQYMVRTSNSKGSVDSPWQTVSTEQAAPQGVAAPTVGHVENDVNSLQVNWTAPISPNGVMQSYQIQRNSSVPLSFPAAASFSHVDSGLEAYTWYSYTVIACSGGGCTTSDATVIRTKEAAPLQVLPPQLAPMGSTTLRAIWQMPQITNGEVSRYELLMDGVSVYQGLAMEFVIGQLIPYQEYKFVLKACTSGGCSQSTEVSGRPNDAPPVGMEAPILRVMSSTSIEVSWSQPTNSNGIITSYDVKREGRLIFTDSLVTGALRTTYTDYSLAPGTEYTYIVIARNRKGNVESPAAKAKTYSSSPTGLSPPTLLPISPSSIQATWQPPINPNGAIISYKLYTGNDKVYEGGPNQLTYTIPNLLFYTEYTVRVEACTQRGCELSTGVTERTMEAIPEEQAVPTLLALANEQRAHSGVLVTWIPPTKPNGVITRYEVLRRRVVTETAGTVYGNVVTVYNNTELRMTDSDPQLKPFASYQYRVTSFNSVGGAGSMWALVVTKEAPPTFVAPPTVDGTTATTITVTITVPLQPNGDIREYSILVNRTVASSGVTLQQTAGIARPLSPFTTYLVQVRACTSGGCTDSAGVKVITTTAKPSGLAAVVVAGKTSTSVTLNWEPPQKPNGHIQRYLLYQRTACPRTDQPFPQSCLTGDVGEVYAGLDLFASSRGLSPYTNYQFQIQAENEAGGVDFPQWVSTITEPAIPVYVAFPRLSTNDTRAVVDWTGSFQLNSRLREYIVMADGKVVFRGISTSHGVERDTKAQVITFVIQAVTETGQAESPNVVFDPSAIGNVGTTAPPVPTKTDKVVTDLPFYQEIWFIIIMVFLGLFLIFLVVFICVKSFGGRKAYVRERAPLHSRVQKPLTTRPYYIDASNGSVIESDFQVRAPSRTQNVASYQGPDMGVINPAFLHPTNERYSFDKLSRSSKTEEDEDAYWDKNFDSGWYDEDAESLNGPAYSYTREQTVFTDTHL
ncbi:usherin-like [Haliotis rufescens]|uniref:usherin-like n=1 Tax=Haliotis rufescens TaxID=6454 RepID=UPI00201E9315|nr:usherin-like [Haliotis rufescens]